MMHVTRANPFQSLGDTTRPNKGTVSTPPAASTASPGAAPAAAPAADNPPSFLLNFCSAMASGPSTTTAAPAATAKVAAATVPGATYSGSNGYYDQTAVDARTAAANAMLGALGSNNAAAYQAAAANFLAASPAGSGLPVWASTVTIDSCGNLINTNCAGTAPDGTVVSENHTGYAGMTNPVPGVPNIADATANYLGTVTTPGT
jgi:hypothetical protein